MNSLRTLASVTILDRIGSESVQVYVQFIMDSGLTLKLMSSMYYVAQVGNSTSHGYDALNRHIAV
jgi:hypothetical protein